MLAIRHLRLRYIELDDVCLKRNRLGCQRRRRVVLAPPTAGLLFVPRHPIDPVERLCQLSRALRSVFWFLGKAGQHQVFELYRDRDRQLRSLRWGHRHSLQVLSNDP